MALVRWNPLSDMTTLHNRVNRLFDELMRSNDGNATTMWSPAADIFETQDAMVLKLEVPGVDRNHIDLQIENNVLTVRGERKFEQEAKSDNYHRVERSYGTFSRSFALPVIVDQEKVRADYKDGVLKISLPKKEQAKAKRIEIAA
jgi:HSP20 family protein